jgi:beta-glucanase (GH16 family)
LVKKALWLLVIFVMVLSVSLPLFAKDDDWELVWSDEFEGSQIDTAKWNFVEKGDGFGNHELEFYTGRPENAYLEKGSLIIKANQENYKGNEYTSAKLITQNKGDWTYGKFEIKAKMPIGQGIWPAIWMMPTDMKMYGGWPNCGEIDIMEYLGHKPDTVYGTIHYGVPWSHTGEPDTLPDGKRFCDDYHVFGLEWLPGEIRWLIDGKVYQSQKYWFCHTPAEAADYTYPAPFDRNFYLQLNVAVGGDWPGDPDDSTVFPQTMAVDYVRVYKYKGKLPQVQDITFAYPDSSAGPRQPIGMGNYVYNGKFDQGKDRLGFWDLKTTGNTAASMSVGVNPEERECRIKIKTPGKTPEAVQLVQDRFILEKDVDYTLKFDARTTKGRSIQVALRKMPTGTGTVTYFLQTMKLNSQMTTYSCDFTMKDPTDGRVELEFNVGDNADDVVLDNISFVKIRKPIPVSGLTLIDGPDYFEMEGVQTENCIEGGKNVGWIDAGDWMKYVIDVKQEGNYVAMFRVASQPGGWMGAQLDAQTPEAMFYKSDLLTGAWQNWITLSTNIYFSKGVHTLFISGDRFNVHWIKLTSNLIKNGTFDKNADSWGSWAAESEGVKQTMTVDKGQLKIDLSSDGNEFWAAQVFQNNLKLEKGKNYRVSFDACSMVAREIQVIVEQNGGDHLKYADVKTVKLTAELKTYSLEFTMAAETDPIAHLLFALGKINSNVGSKHTIYFDNVCLAQIDAVTEKPPVKVDTLSGDQIKNGKFDDGNNNWVFWTGASASDSVENGAAKISIFNAGGETWSVQFNQEDLQLVNGETYVLKFDARSTVARDIQVILEYNGAPYTKYFGPKTLSLTTKMAAYTFEFTMEPPTDPKAHLVFALGKVGATPGTSHDVLIDNVSFMLKK